MSLQNIYGACGARFHSVSNTNCFDYNFDQPLDLSTSNKVSVQYNSRIDVEADKNVSFTIVEDHGSTLNVCQPLDLTTYFPDCITESLVVPSVSSINIPDFEGFASLDEVMVVDDQPETSVLKTRTVAEKFQAFF